MTRLASRVLSVIAVCFSIFGAANVFAQSFLVGAAKKDITGPIVAASTGYNSPGDELSGLGMRLYSRAFVIEQGENSNAKIVALVTADQLHLYQSVKLGVVKQLKRRGFGHIFQDANVLISATHTHAAGSNISWYTLFNLFNGVTGFDELHYDIVVHGITDSIIEAYKKRQPATIGFASGNVKGAAFNRSSLAYNENSDASDFNTNIDEQMSLLRFDAANGEPIGLLNYFGVHTTSLNIFNTRAHGDNKGWAAYKFEKTRGNNFVAAFAQGANGDASPNQPNPEDITLPFLRPSDLNPELDEMEDPIVAGDIQYNAAQQLYNQAENSMSAQVDYRQRYINFNHQVLGNTPEPQYMKPWDAQDMDFSTCVGVVGAGFLAGVEEQAELDHAAEGEVKNHYVYEDNVWVFSKFDLSEVDSELFATLGFFWPLVEKVLQTPKYDACHKEKFALLPVGEVDDFWFPNPKVPFVPVILPLQLVQLGDVILVATPFEITAMAWRRIQAQLALRFSAIEKSHIVLAGMSNAYGMYLTTREEYAAQHFEGAFNSFGPWTRAVVTQELVNLADEMIVGLQGDSGPQPPDLSDQQFIETWISTHGVVTDAGNYGEVLQDVSPVYSAQRDKVQVSFKGAHPRTILEKKRDGSLGSFYDAEHYSFLEIQQKIQGAWQTIATDGDPYTMFDWQRVGGKDSWSGESIVTITWLVRQQIPGSYRIKYNGLAKEWWLFGHNYKAFTGYSQTFALQ